jgi:exoribonuclease R
MVRIMSHRVLSVRTPDDSVAATTLREGISAIQTELKVTPDFPAEVEQAAERAAANPRLPQLDRTDLALVTIDPEESMDLDQAMYLERNGEGYRVFYAIADLAAFITPGDPIDVEANKRGETLYGADSKIPLHPKALSEGAASLLPDQNRPALLWTIEVDSTGEGTHVTVERALVRSRAKLNYAGVQKDFDAGTADPMFTILKEIGEKRLAKEAARGGISLPLPEQEIDIEGDSWRLEFRKLLPVENWNAQISLLTGMGAASLMVTGKVGLLRTLPEPDPRDVKRLHRTARALRIDWPDDQPYPDFIRSLDPARPHQAAMVVASTRLLRGASYVGFNGELPAHQQQAALASTYAHVTAPLRRLGDRYAGEICLALSAGEPTPQWVLDKLGELPDTLRESGRRANQYQNAIVNLVEATVLAPRLGDSFEGVVVELDDKADTRGTVTLRDPAIEATVTGTTPLPLGEDVKVTLTKADVATRRVEFSLT